MPEARHHKAPHTMGTFVPLLSSSYAAPSARTCPRCGCRMSRYATQSETMCAPCSSTVHPWTPPEPRLEHALTRRGELYRLYKGTECACGAPKAAGAKRCKRCHLAFIANPSPYHGRVCPHCAGPKSIGAAMCFTCRYHTKPLSFPSEPPAPTVER